MTSNKRYTKEFKQQILNSLMPPQSKTVSQIVKEEGINRNTVYSWVRKARNEGASIPNSSPSNQRKWPGLVLPTITFIFSLLSILNIASFGNVMNTIWFF